MPDRRVVSATYAILLILAACMVLVAFPLALASCQPPQPQPPPTYEHTSCADACQHARALCGTTTLTPRKGGTCEDVCNATESGGGDFRTGCLSAATTCPAIEACSR